MRGPIECGIFGFGPMRHHGHGHFRHHPFGHGPHGPKGHHGPPDHRGHHDHHGPHNHHGPQGHHGHGGRFGPWMIRPHPFSSFGPCDGDRRCPDERCGPMDGPTGPRGGAGHPKDGPGCPFGRGGPWERGCHRRGHRERSPDHEGPGPMEGPFGRGPWGRGCHRRGHRESSPGHKGPGPMEGPFGRGCGCHRRGDSSPERDGPCGPIDGPGCPKDRPFGRGRCPDRKGPMDGPPPMDGPCCRGRHFGHGPGRERPECGNKGSKEGRKDKCCCNNSNKKDQGSQAVIIERVIVDNDARCNSV